MGGSKVSIPDTYTIHLNPVQLQGNVGVSASVAGVAGKPLVVNAGLDDMSLTLAGNPQEPLKVCVSLAITEIPRIQVHIPTRYDVGFCLFGIPIFNLRVAGETMMLTQDNPPRICFKPPKPVPIPIPVNPQPIPNPISVNLGGSSPQAATGPPDINVTVTSDA